MQRESNNFVLGLKPRLPAGQALTASQLEPFHLSTRVPLYRRPSKHTLPHPWCYLRLHMVSSPCKIDGSHLQKLPAISLYQKLLF